MREAPPRAAVTVTSRTRVMRSGPWRAVGARARELRIAAGLSTCALARRSTVPCASISRFETGRIRPPRSLLSAIAVGIDPDRQKEIIGRLVDAAGGEDALASDGKWAHYRWKRIQRGILSGEVPLPSKLARSFELPDKPASEMTADELADFRRTLRGELRDLERPRRDKKLRQGRAKPSNQREWGIFGADLLKVRPGAAAPREPQEPGGTSGGQQERGDVDATPGSQ